ncbi:hypothetical protein [Melghirimyces algeriensis]|uniref:Uncharacterized protein n=1 Tax=Melghirimyces algeriensis TaxID=910412 RepID=A0A521F9L0_9BACL|nr:hypothetical protein [Melghirimyces algeriensis]SMO92764.1 hypothetical protein SAMN06264849_1151 [Melghirimyces algeriensis]
MIENTQNAQEERLKQLFATWHHLIQTQTAGHDVHRELDTVIEAVFNEIDKVDGNDVGDNNAQKLNKSYASALRDFHRKK